MTPSSIIRFAKGFLSIAFVVYLTGCMNTQPGDTNTQPGGTNTQPGGMNTQPGGMNTQPREPSACGVCGGPVTAVSSIADDRSKPSRNMSVWNRSICGNLLYGGDSRICTQCWHAYSSVLRKWSLALADPAGFQKPLHDSILRFPLPAASDVKSSVVYDQTIDGASRKESVLFWCVSDEQYLSRVRAYAR